MAKSVSANLQTHIDQETTTLATCCKITRQDGIRYALTNHDVTLTVNGQAYDPVAAPISISAVRAGADLSVDNSEAEGLITAAITVEDIRARLLDGALFELFRVNWQAPEDGVIGLQSGELGEIDTSGQTYKIEFRGRTQRLQTKIMEVTSLTCRTTLFTPDRCKLIPDDFEELGQVESVTSNVKFVISNSSQGTDQSATLTNPGAEVGDLSGWTTANVTNSASEARTGTQSFRLGTGATAPEAFQDVSITATGITTGEIDSELVVVDLKAFVRAGSAGDASFLYASFLDGSSDVIATTPQAELAIRDPFNWTRRRVVVRVPALSRTVRIYFGAAASLGDFVYWDDFSVDFSFGQPLANLGGPTDYYDNGLIRFVSSGAAGRSIEIRTLNVSTREIEIFLAIGTIAIGDQVLIYTGCKRRMIEDCKDKFDNIVNFRGEFYTTGKDGALAGPQQDT